MFKDSLQKHVKEIPFEGQEIDMDSIIDTCSTYMEGLITYAFQNFERTSKGYFKDGKPYSRAQIVEEYLSKAI